MRFRKTILGIVSVAAAKLLLHMTRETSWALAIERALEEAAHYLHIERAAMAAALSQLVIVGALIWLGVHVAYLVGKRDRPQKQDSAVLAQREHTAAIVEQTHVMKSQVTRTVRSAFSQTQSIKLLPPFMGGNMALTLDNVAILRLHGPYSMQSLTLLLDVVPMDMRVVNNTGGKVEVQGAQSYFHGAGTVTFTFDTMERKRQEISVAGRTFIVTLLRVGLLDTKGVANPMEFVFGISEK